MSIRHDKQQLLQQIHTSYVALEQIMAVMDDEQKTQVDVQGAWSIKDNLAHLSAWHQRLIIMIAGRGSREESEVLSDEVRQQANERIYQQSKGRTLAEIEKEFRLSYADVIQAIEQLGNDDLQQPVAGANSETLGSVIAHNTYEHYDEHYRAMRKVQERQQDAALKPF